ncbi:MAG: pilus assembly protein [Rhizobiaceae bacterium]|nr:pilus assembly protein [Rhizobiaceae bacterium]
MTRFGSWPTCAASRFAADRSGMGAVEFAMVAPLLFLLYLGGSELTIALAIDRKVEHTASTVNDLVTQAQSLTAEDLEGIYRVSEALLAPYPSEGLQIRVTSVEIDEEGLATVDWSCPTTGMARLAAGTPFTLPSNFAPLRSRTILVAETRYPYTPITGQVFSEMFEMGGISYLDPRIGNSIESTGCAPIAL